MPKGTLEFDLPEDEKDFISAAHGWKYRLAIEQTLYWMSRVCRGKESLFNDGNADSFTEEQEKILERIREKILEECEDLPLD